VKVVCITTMKSAKQQIVNTVSKKATRSVGWSVEMEIGPDLTISVAGYVCTRKNKPTEVKKALMKDVKLPVPVTDQEPIPTTHGSGDSDMALASASTGDQGSSTKKTVMVEEATSVTAKEIVWKEKDGTVVEEEDVGRAYYYGDKLIPFNGKPLIVVFLILVTDDHASWQPLMYFCVVYFRGRKRRRI
jgi:hypothetical protein